MGSGFSREKEEKECKEKEGQTIKADGIEEKKKKQ